MAISLPCADQKWAIWAEWPKTHFHPLPPAAPTGILVGHCDRPSGHPERRYRSNYLRISAINRKFGGMMHSTVGQIAMRMVMSGQFLRVPRNFSMIGFLTRSEGRRYRCNSLRISVISLKFGWMMNSNMKQIAVQSGHARPFIARSVELWNFAW